MALKRLFQSLLIIILFFIAWYYLQPAKTGHGRNNIKYDLVADWPQFPATFQPGNPTGIGIDTNQNIIVFHRASREWPLIGPMPSDYIDSNTILVIDRKTGKIKNSWGAGLFIMPHGLTVDRENNIWVTDVGLHQVLKFSHEGKLLMTLGQPKVPGADSAHFNRPTDIAIAANGVIYISDGYKNSRIIKFTPSGKFISQWGIKGTGNGEFDIPHGIALDDASAKVYVADRENNRIQIFDSSGRYLQQWTDKSFGSICAIAFDPTTKRLIAVDDDSFLKLKHKGSDILIFDADGKVQTRFGRSGSYNGPLCWYHDVAVDNDGNIYTGDILGNHIQKFTIHPQTQSAR